EATCCNSMEPRGMDSTLPHLQGLTGTLIGPLMDARMPHWEDISLQFVGSGMRSGQSTLDVWVRPFHRTTLQLRLRTQESAAAFSPGTVPSTIRTSKDRKQLASPMRQPPNSYRP